MDERALGRWKTVWWLFAAALALAGCSETSEGATPRSAIPSGGPVAGTAAPTPGAPALPTAGTGVLPGQPTAGTTGETPTSLPAGTPLLPCDVAAVLSDNCKECHGSTTNWGAPMPLVTRSDFERLGVLTTDRMITELVSERIHNAANPMPPSGMLAAPELSVLDGWLAAGAPAGTEADTACNLELMAPPSSTVAEDTPAAPLPDNATCYQFLKHGNPAIAASSDTSAHDVKTGETYVNFYYDAPWTEPVGSVSWATVYDRTEVLHHWLFYRTAGGNPDGRWEEAIGTHIGDTATLVAGWAVGGNDVALPDGIVGELPPPGAKMMIEWHLFNTTGGIVPDRSGVEVCTVPLSTVDPGKIAGLTWLGTENFNGPLGMPPGVESKFSGTCLPSWNNAAPGEPITIFAWLPHMHLLGKHMNTWVNRADGTREHVFSEPFQFDRQISYDIPAPYLQINRGDTITAECTYFNDTFAGVPFGPSTEQEMCYQFAFSYPAGALANGVLSLVGATNTCW